jgi:hypothetical protein
MTYEHPNCIGEGGEHGKAAEHGKAGEAGAAKACVPQEELGKKLVAEYKIQKLTDCYTCHR